MFAKLGIPVIDTDIIARELVQPGQPALAEIRAHFGDDVIQTSGGLDRSALRKLVFSNQQALRVLEEILHPRIGAETRRQAEDANGPYQLVVVPLLTGSPLIEFVDRVLVVDCSEEQQLQRLLRRDTESIEQARRILTAQASREARLEIADDVIRNEQGLDETLRQVIQLDSNYRELARVRRATRHDSNND